MKILAIETSCDETAVAILETAGSKRDPKFRVRSNIVSSQMKLHAKFGGVVPNLARREHERNLVPIAIAALKEGGLYKRAPRKSAPDKKKLRLDTLLNRESELLAQFKKSIIPLALPDIDAIAVTYGPGLAPALWVGVNFARALSYLWDKPLIPVNHMAGHFYSALIRYNSLPSEDARFRKIKFPTLALLVSGGHTELVLVSGHSKFRIIGQTLDDAAGEAFDKVARMLRLGYPGGPAISQAAIGKNKSTYKLPYAFPRPMLAHKNYNFSFSGLKTSVLYLLRDEVKKYSRAIMRSAISREFQNAVVEVLVTKTIRAAKEFGVHTVTLGGGVAANALLRQRLADELAQQLPQVSFIAPELSMTGDNALMIALAAYFCGKKKAWSRVQADANLQL
jgi:N6-L-threonylcarbamoyladenine synthase